MSLPVLFSRVVTAKIVGMDPVEGWITVEVLGHASRPNHATIKMGWASFHNPDGAAWQRFIPFEGDTVLVGFDLNGQAHVVGYDPLAGTPDTANGRSGWAAFNEFHERRFNDRPQWADFEPLDRGEWDQRSSGGAYMRGFKDGRFLARGGQGISRLLLNGPSSGATLEAQKLTVAGGPVRIDIGQVRRNNITTLYQEQEAIPNAPTGHPQEFSVEVADANPVPTRAVRVAWGTPAVYQEAALLPEPATATVAPGEPLAYMAHRYPPGTPSGAPVPPIAAIEMSTAGNVGVKGTSAKVSAATLLEVETKLAKVSADVALINVDAPVPSETGALREYFATQVAQIAAQTLTALTPLVATLAASTPATAGANAAAAMAPIQSFLTQLSTLAVNPQVASKTVHIG